MADCLIGLGANLGERAAILDCAVGLLCGHSQVALLAKSAFHATTPIGGPNGQADFLNAAVRVTTSLPPLQLLAWTQDVERQLGRTRAVRWGPRTIDIDLLLYDQLIVDSPDLLLPHPRMVARRFVLEPACEVAPHMTHPFTGWTVARLLKHLNNSLPYVALAGPPLSGKTTLAGTVADSLGISPLLEPPHAAALNPSLEPDRFSLAAELSRLRGRRDVLEALPSVAANAGRGAVRAERWFVSDFWLAQPPFPVATCYDGESWNAYARDWQQVVASGPVPRLVLLLDELPDTILRRLHRIWRGPFSEQVREQVHAYCGRLRREALTPGHGPVLLTRCSGEQAVVELTAAIQAMHRIAGV